MMNRITSSAYWLKSLLPYESYLRGRLTTTARARPFSRSKGSRSKLLKKTNPLIARPLSGCPNCAWYWVAPVWGRGILSTHPLTLNPSHPQRKADALPITLQSQVCKFATNQVLIKMRQLVYKTSTNNLKTLHFKKKYRSNLK